MTEVGGGGALTGRTGDRRLRDLAFESAPNALLVVDDDGLLTLANRQASCSACAGRIWDAS